MQKLGLIKENSKTIFPLLTTRPRTMTFADYQLLTTEQKQGEIVVTDYPVPDEGDYVEVEGDGTKTYSQVLADLLNLIDSSKLTTSSVLRLIYTDGRFEDLQFEYKGSQLVRFYNTYTNASSTLTGTSIALGDTCYYNSTSGSRSSTVCPKGEKIRIYYNSVKTLELGTLAENCMMSDGTSVEDALATSQFNPADIFTPTTGSDFEIYDIGKSYKKGNIASLLLSVVRTNSASFSNTRNEIGKLSSASGMRPLGLNYFPIVGARYVNDVLCYYGGTCGIRPDGTIFVDMQEVSSSIKQIVICFTYITT